MGKTLGKIVEFGSIAVLGVVTAGTGLALAAGASGALGFGLGAVTTLTGGLIGASTAGALAIAGLSAVASILGQPKSPRAESSETAYKGSLPPRVGAYGHSGLFGSGCGLYQTASDTGVAGDVWFFHDNWWAPAAGIDGFYLGDDRVANTRGVVVGLPDGTYTDGKVEIDFRLGARVESAYSQLVALFPGTWTTSHRGDGVSTGMVTWQPVKAANYNKIYPKGQPALRAIGRWSTVYDWRDSSQSLTDPLTWKFSDNAVLVDVHYALVREGRLPVLPMVILSGSTPTINPAWLTEMQGILQDKWNSLFAPTLDSWTAAANDADSATAVPIYRVLLSADADDGDHTIQVPNTNSLWTGAVITFSALDNINHTETLTVSSFTATSITFTAGLAYDHPQGSAVTWTATDAHPITEPRYRCCVVHKLTDPHKDTLAAIRACYDGWVAPREDGARVCYSGRYYVPSVTIGPDEIVSFSFDNGIEDENAVNELTLTYISSEHNYFAVDCTPWRDDEDISTRGRVASQPLQNQVPSYTQARRLAKRQLSRLMATYRGTITTNAAGRSVVGQRYIIVNQTEGGSTWYNGPAEITKLTYNLQTGGVTFDWVAADPNADEWNIATEAGDPAPVGNVVTGVNLTAPTITAAVSDFSAVSDDGTGVRVDITVSGLNRDDVTWFARWRVQGAAVWNEQEYTDIDPGASVQLVTGFVPTGQTIEVEAAYKTGDGRISDYSDAFTVDSSTDTTPPDAATSITVVSWSDTLSLSTDAIARATSYRWRFYKADGTTLLRTIITSDRSVGYTAAQAGTDGVQRSYIVHVAGVNAAGAGTEAISATLTNAAPSTVTGVSASGHAGYGEVDFTLLTESDVAGYVVYISSTSGFDPLSAGTGYTFNGSPAYIENLAAGTFYARTAAYDAWTQRPDLLNFAAEVSFTTTAGSGGSTGGGGGYCVTIDTPILLADGSTKLAGALVVGDLIHTQHEETMEWGDFPVEAIEIVDSADVWHADIGPDGLTATGDHRVWISGWVHMKDIGEPASDQKVAKITITDAHTYVSAGVLSHNAKQRV